MSKKLALLFVFAGLALVMIAMVSHSSTDTTLAQDDPDGDCVACHSEEPTISGRETAWEESVHGTGASYIRGTRASCAGCHSGGAFSAMIGAGQNFTELEEGDPNPTRQDCRTCHNIHTTYTVDDWSLETTDPVNLAIFEGVTFDGGTGNLCANCHQPRRMFEAEEGIANVSSTHWGPHYGMQAAMLLGVNGAGDVEGEESWHYADAENTCVTCHLVGGNHSFEATLDACLECHEDAESFDIEGVQTQYNELFAELQGLLVAKGMLDGDDEHGYHPVVGEYPETEAAALWNYRAIYQDHSHGMHNPDYTIDLLEWSIAALSE